MKVLKILFMLLELVAAIVVGIKALLMITTNMMPLQPFAVVNLLVVEFELMFDIGSQTIHALIKK